jgi:hypothetical protein
MFFKLKMIINKRRIEKLQIRVAKYQALSDVSVRFTEGDTNTYFIDQHLSHVAALAEATAELQILYNWYRRNTE